MPTVHNPRLPLGTGRDPRQRMSRTKGYLIGDWAREMGCIRCAPLLMALQ